MFRFRYQKTVVVLLAVIAGLMVPVAGLRAQNVQSEAAKEAAKPYRAQEWEKAVAAYEKLLADESGYGLGWVHLGISHHNLEQYRQAIEAYQAAVKLKFAVGVTYYYMAASYALSGESEDALNTLQKAVAAGYSNLPQFEQTEEFAALRESPRYAEILQVVRVNSAPCEHLPEFRQFDFWIGEWEVHNARGVKAGENSIQPLPGGCSLLEQWVGAGGGPGQSLNYYDHSKKKWVQMWVGGTATLALAEGEFTDGAMRLTGERLLRNGTRQFYRGTWTPLDDGRVRQFLELSSDGGETWTVWFDGYYSRKQ